MDATLEDIQRIMGQTTIIEKVGDLSHTVITTGEDRVSTPMTFAQSQSFPAFNTSNVPVSQLQVSDVPSHSHTISVERMPAYPIQQSIALDKSGLPWDERIHAGTKTMTEKGMWKKKKGVQEPEILRVETELRANMATAIMGQMQAQPLMQPVPQFPNMPFSPSIAAPVQQPAIENPFAAFNQPMPTVQQSTPATDPRVIQPQPFPIMQPVHDFQTLMVTVTNLFNTQAIDPQYMMNLNGRLGVAAITDIAADPARVEQAFQFLQQDGKIQ